MTKNNRPSRTPQNTLITFQDYRYSKDGTVVRRDYGARDLLRSEPTSLGLLSVFVPKDRATDVETYDFDVPVRERGCGVGSLILQGALAHLKEEEYRRVVGLELTPDALQVRAKVLGKETINFFSQSSPGLGILPVTFEQGLAHAQRAEDEYDAENANHLRYFHALDVLLELDSVDTTKWHLPTPYEAYEARCSAQD